MRGGGVVCILLAVIFKFLIKQPMKKQSNTTHLESQRSGRRGGGRLHRGETGSNSSGIGLSYNTRNDENFQLEQSQICVVGYYAGLH